MELSPTDKRRFSTLAEVLGNPVDAIWGLWSKLQTWDRLYNIARRQVGPDPQGYMSRVRRRGRFSRLRLQDAVRRLWNSVLRQEHEEFRELAAARQEDQRNRVEEEKIRVVGTVLAGFEELLGAEAASRDFYQDIIRELWDMERHIHWVHAALEISGGRTDQFLRTLFAVAIYILQVVSAFAKRVGGEPPTPPGYVFFLASLVCSLVWKRVSGMAVPRVYR